jgi:hypothetical protein
MVLVHLLTLLDLLTAGIMVLGHFDVIRVPLLYGALYLIAKLAVWRDVLSIIDAVMGVYLILIFLGYASLLTWVFLAYVIYKVASFLAYAMGH